VTLSAKFDDSIRGKKEADVHPHFPERRAACRIASVLLKMPTEI
jgi:hypothetical protein